jgi:ElaB/YqjD/DUF883 family membrane-anchored ribosome-binding protein
MNPSTPTGPRYGSSTSPSSGSPLPTGNGDSIAGVLERGRTKLAESAAATGDDLAGDMKNLRADVAKMQETLMKFASQVGSHSSRTMSDVGQVMAGQVASAASGIADAGAEMAATAGAQAKTFASELESMARRNPLGTLAGTLMVGMVLGFISRGGRS